MIINNEDDLGKAIKEGRETIEIEGDLKNKVFRIKATGKVAWAVAIGAIALAFAALFYVVPEPATQVGAKGVVALTGSAAIGILGYGTFISAIKIAFAAGGVAYLNKLRGYRIISNSGDKIVLKKN